jgi:hypothetical protein
MRNGNDDYLVGRKKAKRKTRMGKDIKREDWWIRTSEVIDRRRSIMRPSASDDVTLPSSSTFFPPMTDAPSHLLLHAEYHL